MLENYLNRRKFPVLQAIIAVALTVVALAFLIFGDFRKNGKHNGKHLESHLHSPTGETKIRHSP